MRIFHRQNVNFRWRMCIFERKMSIFDGRCEFFFERKCQFSMENENFHGKMSIFDGMASMMHICSGLVGPKSGNVEKVLVFKGFFEGSRGCLLYTSPSPRDQRGSRMPSSA